MGNSDSLADPVQSRFLAGEGLTTTRGSFRSSPSTSFASGTGGAHKAAVIDLLCGLTSSQNADGQLKKAGRQSYKSQIVTKSAFSSRKSQPGIS
jgi:hypothetical protein